VFVVMVGSTPNGVVVNDGAAMFHVSAMMFNLRAVFHRSISFSAMFYHSTSFSAMFYRCIVFRCAMLDRSAMHLCGARFRPAHFGFRPACFPSWHFRGMMFRRRVAFQRVFGMFFHMPLGVFFMMSSTGSALALMMFLIVLGGADAGSGEEIHGSQRNRSDASVSIQKLECGFHRYGLSGG